MIIIIACIGAYRTGFTPAVLFSTDEADLKGILAVERPKSIPAVAANEPVQPAADTAAFEKTNKINILFLGIDRTDERDGGNSVFRADTIAVVRFDLDTKQVNILSIPRDTYTYLPITNKKDKINHSYAFGSIKGKAVQSVIDAIEEFSDNKLPIDYYLTLDMEPIQKIVDDIGGVEIDVEIAMKTHDANLDKGKQLLNGQQAFDYIHWRYAGMGDIDRIKRQQKFFSALYKKQRDAGKLMDTVGIILKYKDNLKTNMTPAQLYGLAKLSKEIPPGSVNYLSIPGHSQTINRISYWIPDKNEKKKMIDDFFAH